MCYPDRAVESSRSPLDRNLAAISSGSVLKEGALYSEVPGLTYHFPSADLTMHTLFSSNILSPPPVTKPQRDPFELEFHSTTASNSTASATSSSAQSSPTEYNLLTLRLQEERRTAEEYRHAEPAITRRKGHPKLLLMGQRRQERRRTISAHLQVG